jgi:LPS export ABC transporter protein LptC
MTQRRIVFFILAVLSIACKEEKKDETFIEYLGPIMTTDNLNVAYSDSGRVKVKLSTVQNLKFSNQDEEYPKAVFVNFIDKNGVEYSTLRSNSGKYSKAKNLYTLNGNVFFNNRVLNQSLSTEQLFWDPTNKKIYSTMKVTIKTPRESIVATGGMDASEDFSNYRLRKPKGIFLMDSLKTMVDTTGG